MNNIQWVKNKIAARVQSVILVVSLALLLGLVGRLLGGNQLALMMIAGVVILYFVSPMMSPTLFLKFNPGRRLSPEKAPQLYGILRHLARKAELTRMPVLFYMPTDTMLAFTVGPRDNAVIAVSEGLMRGLSRQELAAVLAHEISHIRHNDIRIMTFAGMAGQLTHLLSIFGQFILIFSLPLILTGQVFISWTAIFLLIFSPTLSSLIQLALSRTREYNADMSAAELMGNPEPLASALAKIDRAAKSLHCRMFWPMVPRLPQATLLRTHPPTKERIRRLLGVRDNSQLFQHDAYSDLGDLNKRSCAGGVGRCALNLA
jgi:heat shock protein HtpX